MTRHGDGDVSPSTRPQPDFLYAFGIALRRRGSGGHTDAARQRWARARHGAVHGERGLSAGKAIMLSRKKYTTSITWPARPDGFADAIVWRLGTDTSRMASDGARGPGRSNVLDTRSSGHGNDLAQEKNRAARDHTPAPASWFMTLNTKLAPFKDVLVRRALNFAVDRQRVQQMMGLNGATVTCQVMRPNFPGYVPYCPYTLAPGGVWTAPDLAKAQKLVDRSGTAGMNVTVWSSPPFFASVGSYFVGLLNDLGYHATLKSVDIDTLSSRSLRQAPAVPDRLRGLDHGLPRGIRLHRRARRLHIARERIRFLRPGDRCSDGSSRASPDHRPGEGTR